MLEHSKLERALWWLAQGVEVVPLRPRSKHLVKGFGANSKHITERSAAQYWFERRDSNLGVVCGGLIGLVCADFDDSLVFAQWQAGPGRDTETLTEKTARGYHLYFRGLKALSAQTRGVELKADGVVMTAPSTHPSGVVYEVTHDAPILTLNHEELAALFPFVSAEAAHSSPNHATIRRRGSERPADDLVSRIKAARPVSAEAETLTQLKGRGGHYSGRCPFHEDRHASLWVDDEARLWGCYAASCPTNAEGRRAHDVINLRMWAQSISNRDTLRQLADEFLPLK